MDRVLIIVLGDPGFRPGISFYHLNQVGEFKIIKFTKSKMYFTFST